MVIRRFRLRRPARRSDVQSDCHCQIERCRSASLAGRRPGPDRRASGPPDRRTPAVELAVAFDPADSSGVIVAGNSALVTLWSLGNKGTPDLDVTVATSTGTFSP